MRFRPSLCLPYQLRFGVNDFALLGSPHFLQFFLYISPGWDLWVGGGWFVQTMPMSSNTAALLCSWCCSWRTCSSPRWSSIMSWKNTAACNFSTFSIFSQRKEKVNYSNSIFLSVSVSVSIISYLLLLPRTAIFIPSSHLHIIWFGHISIYPFLEPEETSTWNRPGAFSRLSFLPAVIPHLLPHHLSKPIFQDWDGLMVVVVQWWC